MDNVKGFATDLQTLKSDVEDEVGRFVELLRRDETFRPKSDVNDSQLPNEQQSHVKEKGSVTQPRIYRKRRTTRVSHVTSESTDSTSPKELVNVTTRLSKATNELLTEAALRQRLDKKKPDNRQSILEEAVCHWLNSHNYLNRG